MKLVATSSVLAFFIAVATALAGPGNFHEGDTWKYEYRKIISDPNKQNGNDSGFTDSVSGKITFSLDSIAVKTDSVVWYITKTDSLRETKIYETNDSVFLHDTASRFALIIVNGIMQGEYKEFFSFYQSADTSNGFDTVIASLPATGTYSMTTTVLDATVDNNRVQVFIRSSSLHYGHVGASGGAGVSSNDTLFWIDGLGLFQKRAMCRFVFSVRSVQAVSDSFESYRLIQHNGNNLTVVTSIKPRNIHQFVCPVQGIKTPLRYFDINGRAQGNSAVKPEHHGILLHQRPDGRWDKQVFIH